MRSVNEIMAGLTERHQVIGAIPASLAGLDVMDIEHGVFRLALTILTHMTISGKDIFPDIPEAELWTLLVVLALDLRGAYFLEIELCHFDRCPARGHDLVHQTDRFQVGFHFVLHRGPEPA